jgi:hypothetical protein
MLSKFTFQNNVILRPGVNLTNILRAAFELLFLRQKRTTLKCTKKLMHKKAARKMLVKLTTEMPKEKQLYFMQLKMDITRLWIDCSKRMLMLMQQLI